MNNRLVHEESYNNIVLDYKTTRDYVYDANGNQTHKLTGYGRMHNAPAQNEGLGMISVNNSMNGYYEEYTYNELNQLTGVEKAE